MAKIITTIEQSKTLIKQGKQKSVDKPNKVDPTFNEGDWIISKSSGSVHQIKRCIENTISHKYGYDLTDGDYISSIAVNSYRLWTIEDAKDGDVLVCDNSKCIVIFKNIRDEEFFNSHGFIGCCSGRFEPRQGYHSIKDAHPVTKEQRDLLLTKMKEAGYKWNEDKRN